MLARSQPLHVTVLIVEDHVMFRDVLRKICEKELRLIVVGEAGDGHSAVKLALKLRPELVLLDLHLPNLDGFGVLEAIRGTAAETRIIVLSSHCDEYTVFCAERLHVQGFVDKNTSNIAGLKEAIERVAAGKPAFSEAFLRIKAKRLKDPRSFDKVLTDRERTILGLLGEPLSDDEIAQRLKISVETATKHRFNILKKLDLTSTTEVVRYARTHGFTLRAPPAGRDALLP